MATNKLIDANLKKAKPTEKPYTLQDGEGMFLQIMPSGSKRWRLSYSIKGKRKTISLGLYPTIGLKDAREKRSEAKNQIAKGIDPSSLRKQAKQTIKHDNEQEKRVAKGLPVLGSFEQVAREWAQSHVKEWELESKKNKSSRNKGLLENHIFPAIGKKQIDAIKPKDLRELLEKMIGSGINESAKRSLRLIRRIYNHAIMLDLVEVNVAVPLEDFVPTKTVKHLASITQPKEVGQLLRAIAEYHGSVIVKTALEIAPLVFVRPVELRKCKWADVDLKTAEWRYLATKTDTDHIVPLAKQTIALFERLKPITGHCPYVFPSLKTPNGERPISEGTPNSALQAMGYSGEQMCAHGFRAMARTLLDEVLGVRVDLIEHQLAHVPKTFNGTAYNRTAFLPERAEMMQSWADYLDGLKNTPHNG